MPSRTSIQELPKSFELPKPLVYGSLNYSPCGVRFDLNPVYATTLMAIRSGSIGLVITVGVNSGLADEFAVVGGRDSPAFTR